MGKPNIYQLIKKPSAKLIDMLATDVHIKASDKCPYAYIHSIITRSGGEHFRTFLKHIANQKAEILQDYDFVKSLFEMSKRSNDWVRPISTWKKRSRSREKNIMSLWANKERLSMSKWSTR